MVEPFKLGLLLCALDTPQIQSNNSVSMSALCASVFLRNCIMQCNNRRDAVHGAHFAIRSASQLPQLAICIPLILNILFLPTHTYSAAGCTLAFVATQKLKQLISGVLILGVLS